MSGLSDGEGQVSAVVAWLATWGLLLLAATGLWLRSLRTRDVSVVDVAWGPAFVVASWAYALLLGMPRGLAGRLLLATVTLWGLRLGLHIARRARGRGEDRRYREMRQKAAERFATRSLVTVFWLQATLAALLATPFLLAIAAPAEASGPVACAAIAMGLAVWLAGFAFEAVADWQLLRFQRDATRGSRVMDRGLWRYSRHPNYFGECVLWWGWAILLLPTPARWLAPLAALGMTVLLLRVSGVPLVERGAESRRPGYAEYARRTSPFVPRPPRASQEARS
jgi:steroid 5-alpha reductase family enzyme